MNHVYREYLQPRCLSSLKFVETDTVQTEACLDCGGTCTAEDLFKLLRPPLNGGGGGGGGGGCGVGGVGGGGGGGG